MAKKMNKGLMIYNLKRYLKKKGIDPDTIDLEALIDPTLTYRENKAIINKYIKSLAKNKDVPSEKQYDYAFRQHLMNIAAEIEEERPKKSKEEDEKKAAKKVIDLYESKNPEKDLERWIKHKNKIDILGIDFIPDFSKHIKRIIH